MNLSNDLYRVLLELRLLSDRAIAELVSEAFDSSPLAHFAEVLREWESVPLSEFLDRLQSVPEDLLPLALVRKVFRTDWHWISESAWDRLENLKLGASLARFVCMVRGMRLHRSGRSQSALAELRRAEDARGDSPVLDQYLAAWIPQRRARILRGLGDFQSAAHALEQAVSALPDQVGGSRFHRRLNHDRASLFWASGQVKRGLELHCEPLFRLAAHSESDTHFLLISHLSAGKCAVDARLRSKASEELALAKDLLDKEPGRYPDCEALLVLYSAELDTLYGNDDEGIHLFEYAIELFEALDPPFYPGILDAKIGLIQFTLKTGNIRTCFQRLGELLEEAERNGCLDGRARLLAFQARLLLHDGVDKGLLREAYDNLTTRAHLMNNPHLTLMAYADIYGFAREHLSSEEQKFWLDRLRGLKTLLEESCFEDLYRDYVLEKYRREVEDPLDDLALGFPEGAE